MQEKTGSSPVFPPITIQISDKGADNILNKPDKIKNTIYKQTIHPLISLVSPFVFLVAITLILEDILGSHTLAGPLAFAVIFAVGCLKIILDNIFFAERVDKIHILREFILTIACCYAFFSLLRPGELNLRFYPGMKNVYPTLLATIQWLITFRIHYLFRNRELFLNMIKDKEQQELIIAIRYSAGLARDAFADLRQFTAIFTIQGLILFAAIVVIGIAGSTLSVTSLVWIGIFMLATFLSVMAINLFKQEYAELGEGFHFSRQTQRRRFFLTLLFVSACIILASLFAGYTSLLKVPKIELPALRTIPPSRNNFPLVSPPPVNFNIIEQDGKSILPDLSWLLRLLAPFIKIFSIILVILLFIVPFFSKDFLKWLKSKRLFRFLAGKLSALLVFLAEILTDFKHFLQLLFNRNGLDNNPDNAGLAAATIAGTKQQLGLRKRLETGKIVRLFLKLLSWGRKKGIRYYRGQTAMEFTACLAARFPLLADPLHLAVTIFEEAAFSTHLIGHKAISHYKAAIQQIIKTRKV